MEHPLPLQAIRPIALGLIKNPKNQYLYHQGRDTYTNENFYRPLGGGIDFGETASACLKREMVEELNEDILVHNYRHTLENIFTYENKAYHEIVIIYEAEFKNKSVYEQNSLTVHEHNGRTSTAVWRTLEEIKAEGAHLYPPGLEELIKSL